MVFRTHFCNVSDLWNPEMFQPMFDGWTEIPGLPSASPHNAQTKVWNLRPAMSVRAETINGRMNDRLITTPTKPAERNPQGPSGVQLSVTAQQYFMSHWLSSRYWISYEGSLFHQCLNIAFVNNLKNMRACNSILHRWQWTQGKYAFKVKFPYNVKALK